MDKEYILINNKKITTSDYMAKSSYSLSEYFYLMEHNKKKLMTTIYNISDISFSHKPNGKWIKTS